MVKADGSVIVNTEESVFRFHEAMARSHGRYSIGGELGDSALYASVGPSETARRTVLAELGVLSEDSVVIGSKSVKLNKVLDLTDESVRSALGVSKHDLMRKEYEITNVVGDVARVNGFDAILAPSSANINGGVNLIILR